MFEAEKSNQLVKHNSAPVLCTLLEWAILIAQTKAHIVWGLWILLWHMSPFPSLIYNINLSIWTCCVSCVFSSWILSSYKLLPRAPNIPTEINDIYSVCIKLDDSEVLTLSVQHDTTQTVICLTITGLWAAAEGSQSKSSVQRKRFSRSN